MGFVRDGGAPGGLKKKKGFSPPPPTSPYIKQQDLIRRGSSQPPSFKSLAAPPSHSPSRPLGKRFRLPYSLARFRLYPVQIKCTLFVYLCSYLSSGAVRHVSRIPYLILHWRFAFSDPQAIFDRKLSNLWYPIYFSPHNGGHSCTCSKLPRSSFELRQHYSYNGFNHTDFSRKRQKGAFFKIPSQLQTNISFTNLL